MAKTSKRQDRQRQNTLTPAKSESRRVGLLQEPHLQLAYTFFNARGKKQRTYQPLPSLANAPPSVIELVEKLYKAYKSTVGLFKSKQKKKHEANVRRYLQDSPENSLDHMLKVAFITTNDEEDEVVNRAQPYIPHTFVDTNLLRDALNVGEFKTCQRLARIGDLVQNLLLSELIYEGTDLTSGM